MKTLLLIDGSNYLYRAFHGLPDLRTGQGEPTGAIKGFANMLQMIKTMIKPDLAAVVFDAPGQTFRSDIYSEYKTNRPPMPDDLRVQVEPIHQMIKAQGWPLLIVPGIEADDVIGTLAVRAQTQGMKVFIATGDKDMSQLVNDEIVVVNTMTRVVLDPEGVKEKFGVRPNQIVDYLSLMGDNVDNVPGIYKCGPKTAAKWINDYDTLENLIEHADEIKGKAGEYLREGMGFLPTAKALVTIKTDADWNEWLEGDVESLGFKDEDNAFLTEFYARWEMQQSKRKAKAKVEAKKQETVVADTATLDLFASIPQIDETVEQSAAELTYEIVTDQTGLDRLLQKLSTTKRGVALMPWADATDGVSGDLVGLGLCVDGTNVYLPIKHETGSNVSLEMIRTTLGAWLAGQAKLVTADAKWLRHLFANLGMALGADVDDVTLMSYVIEAHMKHDVENLTARWLKLDVPMREDIVGKGVKALKAAQADVEKVAGYMAALAHGVLQLHEAMQARLDADEKLRGIYHDVERPTQNVLLTMERNGVLVDSMRLSAQSDALGDEIVMLEEQAYSQAGDRFNLASPKQLSDVLFNRLAIPVPAKTKKTASGGYSTSEDVLQQLALDYSLPKLILEFRRLSKLKSTYTDKLPLMVNAKTGRVHTTFGQTTAVTGRLASSDPNVQNIPVRTKEGRQVREAFVADCGKVIVSADYSQIELRIMAHLSQDAGLLDAFKKGLDIHRATAAEVFGVELDAVTSDQRRTAKVINFGLIYGMSAFGLAQNLGIEPSAARNYIERYFARYPGVKAYMEATRAKAHAQGFVETAFGRRLWLPDITSSKAPVRAGAERAAINAPMQGTAADLIKLAMIRVQQWLEVEKMKSLLVLQVHDELVLEVPEDEVEKVKQALPSLMEGVAQLAVPLLAEVGCGDRWESAH
ncbi:MAG: DNA polymerase I [Burkholderiaceae bacterium]|nr:DNA polymerase I [Burkholderiaceae bacterium]